MKLTKKLKKAIKLASPPLIGPSLAGLTSLVGAAGGACLGAGLGSLVGGKSGAIVGASVGAIAGAVAATSMTLAGNEGTPAAAVPASTSYSGMPNQDLYDAVFADQLSLFGPLLGPLLKAFEDGTIKPPPAVAVIAPPVKHKAELGERKIETQI